MLKKEDLILLIVLSTIILIFLTVVVVLTILRYKTRQQQFFHEKIRLKTQFSEILLQSQLEIKEQTLQHIAYELHDNLGQVASLIKINLNTIQFNDQVKAEHKIEDTKELVRQLILDLKSLSISLNSDRVVQIGIVKGLEGEMDRINKTGQFTATIKQEGPVPLLDANTTIILYRMVQEILNNTVKHSNAKRIEITLQASENLLTLVCSDDGVGFNSEEKIESSGSGLLNLQSRAKLIHADLTIRSSPESGTTVSIELPV